MIEYFQNIFTPDFIDSIIKLLIAMFLGMILGIERELSNKDAGIKTYALISSGSCLYILISLIMSEKYIVLGGLDPLRMACYLPVSIGFVCSGIIFLKNKNSISGLSTASSIFLVCAIGISCGFGLFNIAIIATLLSLIMFLTYRLIIWIKKK